MLLRSFRHPLLLLFAIALASMLAFAACDDDDDEEGDGGEATATEDSGNGGGEIDVSGVEELEDGTLTIGSDIAYAPIEFFEEGTDNAVGMDIDIANAMGEKMGVQVEFEQVADFAGIVGDLTSGRYDIVMSAISITPEREAEIDFIPYFGPVGTGILTLKDNPEGIAGVEDLCGRPVAAQDGTFQIEQMETLNADTCSSNPIDIRAFPDNPASVQELILGRVDAQLADDPVAAYSALQNEEDLIELAVPGFEAAPYGIGVRKDSTALNDALTAAFEAIVADGTYADILEEWGQSEFAFEG
jgi:polar amino acid transport system substrate-binding protein